MKFRESVGLCVFSVAVLVLFSWQFNVRPLERFPGWDLFWSDTLVAGKIQAIQAAAAASELPAFNTNYAFGYNLAGEAKALTSYFTPLWPVMVLMDAADFIQFRFLVYLMLGIIGCYLLLRMQGATVLLAYAGTCFFLFVPAHFGNEQYYFCQSFFLLPLIVHSYLQWSSTGNWLWLSGLTLACTLAYSAADIYFIIIIPPVVALISVALLYEYRFRKRELVRHAIGFFSAVGSASFYLVPLVSNLWEIRQYQSELSALGITPSGAIGSLKQFWDYFQQVGLPSYYLPQQSSALVLYVPAAFVFIAVFLVSVRDYRSAAKFRYLPLALFMSGVLMLAGSVVFYLLPEEITRAARGVLRYQLNLWPYALMLSVFVTLAQTQGRAPELRRVIVAALLAGFLVDLVLFATVRPTPGLSSIVGDWFHIKHVARETVNSINRLKPPTVADLWLWLPWLNLGMGGILLLAYMWDGRSRYPRLGLLSGTIVAITGVFSYLVYHNELRNLQQSGWQIIGRSDFHRRAFENRRAELLQHIPLSDRLNYRILPSSADVFHIQRGRNWKLLAETEMLGSDSLKVLYSYRELEHPFTGALYSSLYPSFASSNFFPPLSEVVKSRITLLRPLGIGYVISADELLETNQLELITTIHTPPPTFYETAANGPVHLYKVRRPLSLFWLAEHSGIVANNTETLRKLLHDPLTFPGVFPAEASPYIGTANVIRQSPQSLTVVTHSEKPTQLIASYVYRRFWRAYVDGVAVPITRACGVYMAIDLPAGSHEVVWKYKPLDAAVGAGISMLIIIGSLGLGIIQIRTLRKTGNGVSNKTEPVSACSPD